MIVTLAPRRRSGWVQEDDPASCSPLARSQSSRLGRRPFSGKSISPSVEGMSANYCFATLRVLGLLPLPTVEARAAPVTACFRAKSHSPAATDRSPSSEYVTGDKRARHGRSGSAARQDREINQICAP